MRQCEHPERTRIITALVAILLLASCTVDLGLIDYASKAPPILNSSDINEMNKDYVQIELKGLCIKNAQALLASIEKEPLKTIELSAQEDAQPATGEFAAFCDPQTEALTLRYGVPEPNLQRPIKFNVAHKFLYNIEKTQYLVDFIRPPIPRPVLDNKFVALTYTNNTSPVFSGTCLSTRIEGIQYRIDETVWSTPTAISCTNNTFQFSPPTLTGNPATTHKIEFRSYNSNVTPSPYSTVATTDIRIDTVPEAIGPTQAGVTSLFDQVLDRWLGEGHPTLSWSLQDEVDHFDLRILKTPTDEVICEKSVPGNQLSYSFIEADCTGLFTHGEVYRVEISSTDLAGNTSSSPSSETFTVDRTAPALSFVSGPTSGTKSVTGTFVFSFSNPADESPLDGGPECRLDSGPWSACSSPYFFGPLIAGQEHSFEVRIKDTAGNRTLINHTWLIDIDTIVPACGTITPILGWINTTSTTLNFSCSDDDAVNQVQCKLNSDDWSPCSGFTSHTLTSLQSGHHVFSIRARDEAFNLSLESTQDFDVDLEPPHVFTTQTPPAQTNETTAAFGFIYDDNGPHASGIQDVTCSMDGAGYSPCISPYTLTGPLSENTHTFSIRVRDLAGNSTVLPYSWVVDLTPPNPPVISGSVASVSLRPTWTWLSGGNNGNGDFRYKLDDSALNTGATATNEMTFTPSVDLAYGNHTLYVQEKDAVGNWSNNASFVTAVYCPSGNYFDGSQCQLCPLGKYSSSANLDAACSSAASGTYVPSLGAASSTPCTNTTPNSVSVIYGASSGLTSNNCPISSATCVTNFHWNGSLCVNDTYTWTRTACTGGPTRTVYCRRDHDGATVADAYCTGAKPSNACLYNSNGGFYGCSTRNDIYDSGIQPDPRCTCFTGTKSTNTCTYNSFMSYGNNTVSCAYTCYIPPVD